MEFIRAIKRQWSTIFAGSGEQRVLLISGDPHLEAIMREVRNKRGPAVVIEVVKSILEAKDMLLAGHFSLVLSGSFLRENKNDGELSRFFQSMFPTSEFLLISGPSSEVMHTLTLRAYPAPTSLPDLLYAVECRQVFWW